MKKFVAYSEQVKLTLYSKGFSQDLIRIVLDYCIHTTNNLWVEDFVDKYDHWTEREFLYLDPLWYIYFTSVDPVRAWDSSYQDYIHTHTPYLCHCTHCARTKGTIPWDKTADPELLDFPWWTQ